MEIIKKITMKRYRLLNNFYGRWRKSIVISIKNIEKLIKEKVPKIKEN